MNLFKEAFFDVPIGTEVERDVTIEYEMMYNDTNGYGAYSVTDNFDENSVFNISGIFVKPLVVGQTYLIKGSVCEYRKQKQLKVNKVIISRPQTKKGIITYLRTLDKIGEKRAELIFNTFGVESIDVLMKNPERVVKEIKRVSKDLATNWQNQLKELIESDQVLSKLYDFGLSVKESKKIFEVLGDDAVEKIEENPYVLSKLVRGFGFEKCDRIARMVGISPTSPFRVVEGVIHTLKQASIEGHCYLKEDELVEEAKKILDVRLTYQEMVRLSRDNAGKSSFYYEVGKREYLIKYDELMSCIYDFQGEQNRNKKSKYRYPLETMTDDIINESIDSLRAQGRIMLDIAKIDDNGLITLENRVYLKELYKAEIEVAMKILELSQDEDIFTREEVESTLDEILKRDNVVLEEMQREACISFNTSLGGFCLLIGSAGTGKTFTLKYILEVARLLRQKRLIKPPKMNIYAPTGKASKVASKATGMDCSTIHKGLGYNPATSDFEYNEDNPFESDIIICDESSMLDIRLANSFFRAIKNGSKVILMGDIKQLASVGPGNVLKDIMQSDSAKVVELKVVKRQGLDSGIIENANNIIDKKPIVTCEHTKDAYFLPRESNSSCQKTLIQSIYNILNNRKIEFNEIQVLSPQRSGALGVYVLNYLMQKEFNPGNNEITVPALKFTTRLNETEIEQTYQLNFKKGDKIINTKNDYDLEQYRKDGYGNLVKQKSTGITNGECGVIENIERISKNIEGKPKLLTIMTVKYEDFYAKYEDDFSDLEHAYCLTIHKSQGSAWRAVVLPFSNSHFNMLDNNLIYTAWTRAREFAVAIGQSQAVIRGVKKSNASKRNTTLSDRLQGKIGYTPTVS